MGCECLNKKSEEPEVKKEEKKKHVLHRSDSAIENEFNIEEYENVILNEKNEYEDKITDLDSNIQKENEETTNRFNFRALELINKIRRDPPNYSKTILDNIQYIINEGNGEEDINKYSAYVDCSTFIEIIGLFVGYV